MEIRRVNGKKGNKIELVNESWSTSNAWGHKTNVFKNGLEIGCQIITTSHMDKTSLFVMNNLKKLLVLFA